MPNEANARQTPNRLTSQASTVSQQQKDGDTDDNHVVGYFHETTVHGFRYVVEGRNFAEKTTWVLAILLAFLFAIYLVLSSVREAKENPISTSIDIKTINEIPFPAVTVAAGGGDEIAAPYRPVMDVLNAVKFDCSEEMYMDQGKCLKETSQVRKDFAPLIRNTVKTLYEVWKKLVASGQADLDFREWPYDPNRLRSEDYPKKLLRIFCKLSGKLPEDWSEDDWLNMLADNFFMSRSAFETNTKEYIKSLWPTELQNQENVNITSRCTWDEFGTDEIKAMFHTLVTLKARAYLLTWQSELHHQYLDLGLGDLLAFSYYSKLRNNYGIGEGQRYVPVEIDAHTAKQNSSFLPDKIFTNFFGRNDSDLSAVDILNALSTDMFSIFPRPMTSIEDYRKKKLSGKLDYCATDYFQCRNITKHLFSDNFEDIIRVLKYTRQAIYPAVYMTNKAFAEDIERALKDSNYTQRCSMDESGRRPYCRHADPQIVSCYFGDAEDSVSKDCRVFQPTFSTKGLAYTFNSGDMWSLYKPTDENKMMNNEVFNFSQEGHFLTRNYSEIESASQNKQLMFHLRQSFLDVLMNEKTYFWISVHNPHDVATDFVKLSPGYSYTITVTPSMVTAGPSVGEMREEVRQCRPHDDQESISKSNIFSRYTYSSCLFECKLHNLNEAMDDCQPWDTPQEADPIRVCQKKGDDYARKTMRRDPMWTECDCLPDCNSTTYSYSIKKERIVIKKRLLPHQGCDELAMIGLHPLLSFLSDPKSVSTSHRGLWEEACKKERQHQTQVTVKVVANTVSNIMRMRRVTFTDQMANLGGVIGLFTGMSFLSLLELVFWLCRGGTAAVLPNKRNGDVDNPDGGGKSKPAEEEPLKTIT